MAVYKRTYKPYEGRLTPRWSRFLIPARYALSTLFQSRLLLMFTVLCYVLPIVVVILVYLRHNFSTLELLGFSPRNLIEVNANLFAGFLSIQGFLAMLMTSYAGPGLISPDLSNNALPLYLCRPISRTEYVVGKMMVLFLPLSAITWVPAALVWILEATLEGNGWASQHMDLMVGTFVGSWLWILFLSLVAMALSAWVRWRLLASGLQFGIFFIAAAFSNIVNEVLETTLGHLVNPGFLIGFLWAKLLSIKPRDSLLGSLFNIRRGDEVPVWAAWTMFSVMCIACIWLLNRRLRAREVVS